MPMARLKDQVDRWPPFQLSDAAAGSISVSKVLREKAQR